MKKLSIWIVIIVAAGAGAWLVLGNPYAISADMPLGSREKLEAHFRELGLEQAPADRFQLRRAPANAEIINFIDKRMTAEYGGFTEQVTLTMDADGRLIAVGGIFVSTRDMASFRKTRVMRFLMEYWQAAGGRREDVANLYNGIGSYGNNDIVATFSTAERTGTWTAYPPQELIEITRN